MKTSTQFQQMTDWARAGQRSYLARFQRCCST